MASPERSKIREYAFKGAKVLVIGLALLAAVASGVNLIEGDLVDAKKAFVSAGVYALIAGGIIYAEKQLAANDNSNPPRT